MSEHTLSGDGTQGPHFQRTAGQPVTARGEATLRRILDVAEEVFGERGYYGTSISEITRRANIAQGTYYLYFHSKLEIFVRLIEDLGHQLRTAIRAASAGADDRLEIERRGFLAFFAFVAEHRRIYRIVQDAERVAPEAVHEYYHHISDGYVRGLRKAMNAGEIAQFEPEALTYALMGIGHFVALRWLVWPEFTADQAPNIPHEITDAIVAFIARGLAPDGTALDRPETESRTGVEISPPSSKRARSSS